MLVLPKEVIRGAKAIPADETRGFTGRLYFDGPRVVVTDGHVLFFAEVGEANGLSGRYLDVERLRAGRAEVDVNAAGELVAHQAKSMDVQAGKPETLEE